MIEISITGTDCEGTRYDLRVETENLETLENVLNALGKPAGVTMNLEIAKRKGGGGT